MTTSSKVFPNVQYMEYILAPLKMCIPDLWVHRLHGKKYVFLTYSMIYYLQRVIFMSLYGAAAWIRRIGLWGWTLCSGWRLGTCPQSAISTLPSKTSITWWRWRTCCRTWAYPWGNLLTWLSSFRAGTMLTRTSKTIFWICISLRYTSCTFCSANHLNFEIHT